MGQVQLRQINPATQSQLIALADMPIPEQARQLGLTPCTVKTYRSTLIRAGLIRPRARTATPDDIARMRRLAGQGLSLAGIAERIGISTEQCWRVMRREGIALHGEHWGLRALEQLFDVSRNVVEQWRDENWLTLIPARGETFQKGVAQQASRADLTRFLHVRAAWPSYTPARVADPALRALAEQIRSYAGGAWVPLIEVAQRAGIEPHAVRKRAATSPWLAGWDWTRIGRAWFLWWPTGATLPVYVPRDAWQTRRARMASAAD
jgi:DNA-binding transcriptional MerR regulator